ncbi:TfuA-like protein [Kitasatospora sp. NPDC056783]|uniref:TfuA-like protein n=1 Tax=Kitasatospora sp. NPDC056783 TaxID=3345943 RepID=UPI003691C368
MAIFAGPSLYDVELSPELRQVIRPPARQGDISALPELRGGTWRIALIDGEFGQSLSVTVTEIREALAAGNTVLGGGSMGALRAAECHPLGMRPVGWIVRQYLDSTVWADDEVALTYDPADYRPLSMPLINLRWLLDQCVSAGELDPPTAQAVLSACSALHFRERTARTLLDIACAAAPKAAEVLRPWFAPDRLSSWDRKRADAEEILRLVSTVGALA